MSDVRWIQDLYASIAGKLLVVGGLMWWSGFGIAPLLVIGTACYFLLGGFAELERTLKA